MPRKHGFNEWFGYLNQAEAYSNYPEYLWRNEEKVPLPGNANGRAASKDRIGELAGHIPERIRGG